MKNLNLQDNSLHNLHGGIWNQREIKKLETKNLNFERLRLLSTELNSKLHDKGFLEKNLYLFGENYEHNTDDNLLTVFGWNKDNYMLETGNLVGYVSTNNYQLNITSRFGDSFLKYLLCYSEGFLEVPNVGTIGRDGLFEWVMVFLWKNALKSAFRLGIPKQYISLHEKVYTIKGNVDVLNYAINKGADGKTLCHFYQHDYNNPVTRLIAYTFSVIRQKKLIKDCMRFKNAFESCAEGKKLSIEAYLNTRPITNPYYSEYNKVINLSKFILRKQFGDLTDTSSILSAFLFDMSMLFEHYIRKVLTNGKISLFPKNDDSMAISRGLGKNDDRHLYPDIIIDRGENKIEVYDVKYKHFNTKTGVKREDLFQLHTYVSYLSNDYNVLSCGIIYPNSGEDINGFENNIIRHPNNTNGIPFHIRFFNIPKTESTKDNKEDNSLANFKEYMGKMRYSENGFIELFSPPQ